MGAFASRIRYDGDDSELSVGVDGCIPGMTTSSKIRLGRVLLVATGLLVAAAGTVGLAGQVFGGANPGAGDRRLEEPDDPLAPAFTPPPQAGPESWRMPHLWRKRPPFPYLPDEDRTESRSVGSVTHGYLINSVEIPQPHPALTFLSTQYERKLFATSERMKQLVVDTANHVREEYSDAVVQLGNFGRHGGGDIPYSVSHNSGRDADFGFFVTTPDGESTIPKDLVKLDASGRYEGDDETYVFDTPRNWELVEGLIEHAGDQLQYIFVSNPLKRKLLEHARRSDVDDDVLWRARKLLHQPRGALPHNDHFHVRLYCSETDVRSGCRDQGIQRPWYDAHTDARREAVREARRALESDKPSVRSAGARRLAVLEANRASNALENQLSAESAVVRASAARALARTGTGTDAIAERLAEEPAHQAYLEMVDALSRLGGTRAVEALTAELDRRRDFRLPGGITVDGREFVAEGLIRLEDSRAVADLLEVLEADDPQVRAAAARALRYLTNQRFGGVWRADEASKWRSAVDRWREWYDEHGNKSRDTWLRRGFAEAGFDVDRLDADHVWPLCRAVEQTDFLSYNAQRVLMRISGRQPDSLRWPKHDANFYWRRWFERRWRRFGAPPIPEELSTLD